MTNPRMRAAVLGAAGLATTMMIVSACSQGAADDSDGAETVGLIEVQGDSELALDDYNNGALLAVDDINRAGGVLGKDLKYTRIPASVVDPQEARAAFLKATDRDPAAIFGFPGGGSLEALTREVDGAGIPMIHLSSDGKLAYGAEGGSKWLFSVNPDDVYRAVGGVQRAKALGAKKIGIIATDETFGRVSTENSLDAIEEAGLELGPVRYVSPTSTDLTSAVLDMKDVDAVLSWTFPNILALQLQQMQQNDLAVPVITGNSGPLVVANELAKGPAVDNLYAVTPCEPAIGESETGRRFAAEYEKEYGVPPTASATQVYDAQRILAAAVEEAGSTDPGDVLSALEEMEYSDGACASVYKSDGAHFLGHQYVVIDYAAGSKPKIVETVDVPEADRS